MALFNEINSENKLRLTISYLAMNTLQEDQAAFEMGTATLINKIIHNFYPMAKSSLSIQLDHYRASLIEDLGSNKEDIINTLMEAQKNRLMHTRPKYKGDMQTFVIRLNKANLFLLTEDTSSHEELYYPKGLKSYIEAMLEEFARLPFIEREKIYFFDIYEKLQKAMKEEHAVYLFHSRGNKYLSKIYTIDADPLSMYTYVIAQNINPDNPKTDGKAYSYRLSRIDKVIEKTAVSGTFTTKEKERIETAIANKGIQFVRDHLRKVVVSFTDNGLKAFNNQMHLRPRYTKIGEDKHTYEFECTTIQAFFYFIRLGSEVKILKPVTLAKKIKDWHKNAATIYNTHD